MGKMDVSDGKQRRREGFLLANEDRNNLCEAEGSPAAGGLPWGAGWEQDAAQPGLERCGGGSEGCEQ